MADSGERRERTMNVERRMTDVEAMMWNVEKDPHLSSTFGSITIFDRSPDFEKFRRRMLYAVAKFPRLRQHVVPSLGRLAPPEWQFDPEFDIDRHVRHIALPGKGSERDLFDFAAQLVADAFDRTRPLWEFVIVDGVEGGRAALVQKMHHTITDGEGGIRLSEQFIDLARNAPEPEIPEIATPESNIGLGSFLDSAMDMMGHSLRRNVGIARRTAENVAHLATHPVEILGVGAELGETAKSALRQMTVTDPARSPLWHERGLQRRLLTLDVPFDDAKRASKNLGGSLNDFFVAGAAAAAGAYHRTKGAPVDELRMAMPVSTRTDGSAGGNSFAPLRVLVPTGDLTPAEQFAEVRDRLAITKTERAIGVVGGIAGIVNVLPTSVLVRFARQQVETVDFATSNLRAAPFDLYMAGAKVEANYPLGPLSGTAFNLTMMSYRGVLNMGLHVDTAAIDEPELLASLLAESYAELIAAGA